MFKITKAFSASENGTEIARYKEGSLHLDLPPVALAHGKNIDAYTKLKGEELKKAKAILDEQAAAEDQE
jgi:hypothetical protein